MARINHNGYVEIYIPGHHRARGNGYVFLHIIIAEAKIGRALAEGEQVHHIDGDNDPDNLEVVDIADHARITSQNRRAKNMVKCSGCGSEIYRKPSHQREQNFCALSCKAKNQNRGKRGYFG